MKIYRFGNDYANQLKEKQKAEQVKTTTENATDNMQPTVHIAPEREGKIEEAATEIEAQTETTSEAPRKSGRKKKTAPEQEGV